MRVLPGGKGAGKLHVLELAPGLDLGDLRNPPLTQRPEWKGDRLLGANLHRRCGTFQADPLPRWHEPLEGSLTAVPAEDVFSVGFQFERTMELERVHQAYQPVLPGTPLKGPARSEVIQPP